MNEHHLPCQTTIAAPVRLSGTGLHSGQPSSVTIRPAPPQSGITFRRTDLPGQPVLPARFDLVDASPLCTKLRLSDGTSVSTIEHLMAALAGAGVDNAMIDIDGPEIPILDGSALPFIASLSEAGKRKLPAPRREVEILSPLRFERDDGAWAELLPAPRLRLSGTISFAGTAIGVQSLDIEPDHEFFIENLAPARTFCLERDVSAMHQAGLARGGSPDSAVIFAANGPVAGQTLRFPDEPIRHKLLDALGDLALFGSPIRGHYRAYRPGHRLTNSLLRALAAAADNWRICTGDTVPT